MDLGIWEWGAHWRQGAASEAVARWGKGRPAGGGRPGFRDGDSGSGIASRSAARTMRGQRSPVASTRISGYRAVATAGQASAVMPGYLPISRDGSAPGNGKRHGQNRMAMMARPKSNDDEGAFLPIHAWRVGGGVGRDRGSGGGPGGRGLGWVQRKGGDVM